MLEQSSHLDNIDDTAWTDDCECMHPRSVMAARVAIANAGDMDVLARMFTLFADSTRLQVLTALASGELCVTDLAAATGINRTTISHQLRILRQQRLVRRRRDGKVVYYMLDDDHVTAVLDLAASHVHEGASVSIEATA